MGFQHTICYLLIRRQRADASTSYRVEQKLYSHYRRLPLSEQPVEIVFEYESLICVLELSLLVSQVFGLSSQAIIEDGRLELGTWIY